jgi:hypothetical protein
MNLEFKKWLSQFMISDRQIGSFFSDETKLRYVAWYYYNTDTLFFTDYYWVIPKNT